jgi:cellulose synthase/poly-beta-1,6-N-acetylglucosamine synthase-like glycosyltransferase
VTDLVESTTYEEANHRTIPWIKQRSRWLKGYWVTYLVHMRHPLQTLNDLGPWKFIGFQMFFLSILVQFTLAPILWGYWGIGIIAPQFTPVASNLVAPFTILFVAMQMIEWAVPFIGVSKSKHRGLRRWIPTTILYFPFATLGMYKGLWELFHNPFYWDKTEHGLTPETHPTSDG